MAHDHRHHVHHENEHHAGLADILDLDAEVLHEHLTEVMAWVHGRAGDPATVLDLGAGTGAGTLALARRFPDARITAVDVSPQMLEYLRHKAHAAGVAGRIRTVEADLDTRGDIPGETSADLVWAANSLHHLADPVGTLRTIRAAIRPGGHLVALEMSAFPRFLPGDTLEARCHAAVTEARVSDMPHLGADWAPLLRAAGFTVQDEHRFEIDLRPPLPEATGRYAQATLRRLRDGLEGRLSPEDLAALEALAEAVPHRADLTVQASRTAWLATP
ncbi:methyltransferase domain-containing protein [Dactylosporangium sp. NBC_01737]|uniref:methyltransferase domain-containing protein n=1 Tax=Dactylosporangium sp. NBC_01737 TaxID=2975959 RepID=UPI002E114366|nr:methyltransferase domain-containing protein [Dactylosporangium sp. NBC_01737]